MFLADIQEVIQTNLATIITAATSCVVSLITFFTVYFKTRSSAITKKIDKSLELSDYYIKTNDGKIYKMSDITIVSNPNNDK